MLSSAQFSMLTSISWFKMWSSKKYVDVVGEKELMTVWVEHFTRLLQPVSPVKCLRYNVTINL